MTMEIVPTYLCFTFEQRDVVTIYFSDFVSKALSS